MSRKQPDMTALAQLLATEISPKELGDKVDEAAFGYADRVISMADETIPTRADADTIYWLRRLRDALWQTAQ